MWLKCIDGQVRLVRLIRLKTDNFRLHDEQTVNGLRKIGWVYVIRLNAGSIYINIFVCSYVYTENRTNAKR